MNEELNLEERELCPDGGCIGVLGDDRKCKVCGTAADGTPGARPRAAALDEPDEPDEVEAAPAGEGGLEIEGDPDDRELCPDGTCIGLIGEDGRCKVCGARGSR